MMNTAPTIDFPSPPSRSDMCFSVAAEALTAPPAAMPPALCSSPSCSTTPIIILISSLAHLLLNDVYHQPHFHRSCRVLHLSARLKPPKSKLSSSTIETMN
ncbi:hypothetical protein F2Q69_00039355 [Brassica cretica]|uniref:Uncharacterized protein n=1 Tax=Brassica cretica TaxID=69181 RepID=A0A8S9NSP7_BRACR|nr:hypothetical protein F2Q69_00039355 [Brassica cretica]